MAQKTVKTYADFLAAIDALSPGGKIIINPDPDITVPESESITLPAGDWNIIGKTVESELTVNGTITVEEGGSLLIQGCKLNLSDLNAISGNVEMKDVVFADVDAEDAVEDVIEEHESDDVEDTVDDVPEEIEPEIESEPEKPEVTEVKAEPKKAAEPKSQPEVSGESRKVSKASIHLGPSAKSRKNTFSGSVKLTGITATDAIGHVWFRVTYKLPGSGRKAVGYIRQSEVE